MARGEDYCAGGKDNGAEHNAAEKEEDGRDYRERQRAKHAVFAEANNPDKAVRRNENEIDNKINNQSVIDPEPEISIRNVYDHKDKTTEPSDLFERFEKFVVKNILEAVLAFNCKNDIRNHNQRNKNKPVIVKPRHIQHLDQPFVLSEIFSIAQPLLL